MKIIVLHGEDSEKSYDRLKKFIDTAKTRSWEVTRLDEPLSNLQETLRSTSLFGGERFFILTDIKKLGKKELMWLNKEYLNLAGTFIIYHPDTLNVTFLKSLPQEAKIEEYKLPKMIWMFLEHIHPGNAVHVLQEFHKIIESDAPEFIFSLIGRQMRDLYWVKTDPNSTGFPSWKTGKLKSQADRFTKDQLILVISELSRVDVEVKTGKAEIVSSIDLLIAKQLE